MVELEFKRKCNNCKGKGFFMTKTKSHQCYYCRGLGNRTSSYGQDKLKNGSS